MVFSLGHASLPSTLTIFLPINPTVLRTPLESRRRRSCSRIYKILLLKISTNVSQLNLHKFPRCVTPPEETSSPPREEVDDDDGDADDWCTYSPPEHERILHASSSSSQSNLISYKVANDQREIS